jgi:transposase
MFKPENSNQVWLVLGKTDMRKSINGLAALVHNQLKLNPLNGQLYVFCGRHRDRLKILYWDHSGYALWYKRLERDRFCWPRTEQEAQAITGEQLAWLLSGLDISRAHRGTLKISC